MTPDEMREAAERVAAFTRGNDPNPNGMFPSGSYLTHDEARERGQGWVARPGEPQDLRDPYHYQSPDEARALGREWGSQPAIMQGRATHAGWQGGRAAVDPGLASLGGDSGGGGSYSSPSSFAVSPSWPTFTAPQLPTIAPFQAPPAFSYEGYAAPTPFSYDPFAFESFNAPSLDQAQNEPGYAFARDEGLRALQNAKAARGTLNTGGTLKDILGWGNRFAEQNYGNVYNRASNTYSMNRGNAADQWTKNRGNAFENWGANEQARAQAYDRNRGNAFDTYKTNYDVGRDVYDINRGTSLDLFDRAYRSSLAEFAPRFDAASATFGDIAQRDRDRLNSLTQIATAGAGA